MIVKILGIFFIVLGTLFLFFPEKLRKRLTRKGVKSLKRWLFFFTWIIGCAFIGVAWGIEGILGTILMVLGIIALIKGVLLLKSTVAEKMIVCIEKISINALRGIAVVYISFGVFLYLSPQLF